LLVTLACEREWTQLKSLFSF